MRAPLASLTLVAALALASSAQEARRVRLELQDGTVVEGRLEAFAGRVYRVVTAEGATREVAEKDVARVAFDAAEPAGTPTACAALADVLRRAEASGALATRVLGRRHVLVTETGRHRPEAPGGERRFLLEVDVRRDAARGELVVELAYVGARGERHDPYLFDFDADGVPVRARFAVGLADGRALRGEGAAGAKRYTWSSEGGRWSASAREGDRDRTRDAPWTDDLLLEPIVVFVLAPLQDQGLPPSLSLRLARPKGTDDGANVRRLRRLPGQGPGGGVVVELSHERGERPRPALRLRLEPDGRLAGLELDVHSDHDGVSFVSRTVRAEVIDAERHARELEAWGAGSPPPLADGAPWAPAEAGAHGSGAPFVAADPLVAERWFVRRAPPLRLAAPAPGLPTFTLTPAEARRDEAERAVVRIVHVVGRRAGDRLTFEVTEETPGDPRATTRDASTYDAGGHLVELIRESRSLDGAALTVRLTRRGDRLEGLEERRRGPVGAWPGDVRRSAVGSRAPGDAVAASLALYGATTLGGLLESPLQLRIVSALVGGLEPDTPLLLERRAVPEGARVLPLGRDRQVHVPEGRAPAFAVVVAQDDRRPPHVVVFTDAAGAPLAHVEPRAVGQDEAGATSLLATADEVQALRVDPKVVGAGRTLRAVDQASSLLLVLHDLHGKQEAFRGGDLDHDGEPDFAASLEELGAAGQAEGPLRAGEVSGYRVVVVRAADAPGERWLAVANPLEPGEDAPSLAITQEGALLRGPGPFEARPDAAPPAGAELVDLGGRKGR